MRFSDIHRVNEAVDLLVRFMGTNPYDFRRVKSGTMTVADVIEQVRRKFGVSAARSIRITVH